MLFFYGARAPTGKVRKGSWVSNFIRNTTYLKNFSAAAHKTRPERQPFPCKEFRAKPLSRDQNFWINLLSRANAGQKPPAPPRILGKAALLLPLTKNFGANPLFFPLSSALERKPFFFFRRRRESSTRKNAIPKGPSSLARKIFLKRKTRCPTARQSFLSERTNVFRARGRTRTIVPA